MRLRTLFFIVSISTLTAIVAIHIAVIAGVGDLEGKMALRVTIYAKADDPRLGWCNREPCDPKIENVTFYLPVPAKNGEVMEFNSAYIPEGWNVSVVDTIYGRMLRIDVAKVKNFLDVGDNGFSKITLSIYKTVDELDTENPFNEYLLVPKFNLSEAPLTKPTEVEIYRNAKMYRYETVIYSSRAPPENWTIVVDSTFEGANFRRVLWLERWANSYSDSVSAEINSSGWIRVSGKILANVAPPS